MSTKKKTLSKNYFIPKIANRHLNLQWVIIFLVMESAALMLMAADWSGWWFLEAGVAVAISYNKTTMVNINPIGRNDWISLPPSDTVTVIAQMPFSYGQVSEQNN